MTDTELFPQLSIPETLAAGPGPGNTDARVLASFANAGLADHMQADVLRGMVEAKHMLRRIWGTKNTYTFGVGGTGFSGLDVLLLRDSAGRHRGRIRQRHLLWHRRADRPHEGRDAART
jgi:alanine-glyoxylate transaminase/serine-glyoxylate transaminase/serine-pyruvate transaminase